MKKFLGKGAIVLGAASALLIAGVTSFAAEDKDFTTKHNIVVTAGSVDPGAVLLKKTSDTDKDKDKDENKSKKDKSHKYYYEYFIDFDDVNLTEAEKKELKDIYKRSEEIVREVFDDAIDESDLSKLDDGFKKYEKELDELGEKAEALEKKAGIYEKICINDDDLEEFLDDFGDEYLKNLDIDKFIDNLDIKELLNDADIEGFLDELGDEIDFEFDEVFDEEFKEDVDKAVDFIKNIDGEDISEFIDILQDVDDTGIFNYIFDDDYSETSFISFLDDHEDDFKKINDRLESLFDDISDR
ncbi:hypothetical protein SAMN04487934_105111 [Eubacterium ruminantium]|nr:hypothetical protein SAMN04487934_105111 [Eubacterium ruminantium]